ncbi:MAG: hypothetical protein HZC40_04210 [Chloroflexi bacterium]|nr:hypothetical protein [Chloroflexota bacterium]
MEKRPIHKCHCSACRSRKDSPTKQLHAHINFLVSTLDEDQRRVYVGLESQRLGYGGDRMLAQITGLSAATIAAGRRELQASQATERIRMPGGGRPRVEKKMRRS